MKRRSDRRNLSKKIKEGGEGQKKERQGGGFKEKVKVQRQMEEKIDMRFMHGEE